MAAPTTEPTAPAEDEDVDVEALMIRLGQAAQAELAALAARDDPDRAAALGAWLIAHQLPVTLAPRIAADLFGWAPAPEAAYQPGRKPTPVRGRPRVDQDRVDLADLEVLLRGERPGWWAMAACRGMGPDLWHPVKQRGADNHARTAKRICASCPVRVRCLTASFAEGHDPDLGIRGGAGGDVARGLRRLWAANPHDPILDDSDPDACSCDWCTAARAHFARLAGGRAELVDRNGAGATHGLRSTYNRGCRCERCAYAALLDRRAVA